MLGFQKAKYGTILCMDADLQHEPEAVPSVAAPVMSGQAEFSVGSRNVDGGSIGETGLFTGGLSARLRHSLLGLWQRRLIPCLAFSAHRRRYFSAENLQSMQQDSRLAWR